MPSKSELQNLLRKMGGTPESGDSVDETIKKISEVYEPGGGGSGLPEGGSTGQVVKKKSSAEGDAEWADESVDYVTFTVNKTPFSCTADKTYQEVKAGLNNGRIYFALVKGEYFANGTSYGRPNVWNLEWISGSDITFYRSIKNPNASDDNHITIEYQRVSLLADGTARAAITNDRYATPKDCVKYLELLCDNSGEYQDSPTGTFSVYTDAYGDISDIYFDVTGNVTIELCYGNISLEGGGRPANYEEYELVSASCTNGETEVITLTFRTISMRNGTPVLKTVTITDTAYSWDSLENATVTYSEEVYEPGGGGGTLVVTLTRSGSTVSSDKSPSQIYDAFLDGKQIYAKYANGDAIYPLYSCASNEAYFTNSYVDNSAISCSKIRVYKYAGQIRVESSGGNVSTVKRYTFGFLYDSSKDEYTYDGCLETGSPDSFFWASKAGNACLTVSYESTSGHPIKETAWVQKQSLEYEEIDGNSVPIGRAHFINLSIPTMMITDYEMVWDLEDGNFKELNVTKIPLGGSN